ncbi:helix-turn-helix domain-containing protein [Robertmurraya korlensis]|uniref:helix-turn-helix domain-containing protein n=1 Tax=Robertmurraya korlensis TaxID=519977 RepID=UPI000ACD6712|nr:helix-turn-helix domain-containing protein [Robertmurraya korlensis]
MNEKKIIHLSLDEEGLKELYLSEVKKHLENIQMETILMDSKELCKMLNLSWPTIEKLFLCDPNFPYIRIGKKWIFNRNEVQDYIDRWFIEIRELGGRVNI